MNINNLENAANTKRFLYNLKDCLRNPLKVQKLHKYKSYLKF